jgi:hypothetical protein
MNLIALVAVSLLAGASANIFNFDSVAKTANDLTRMVQQEWTRTHPAHRRAPNRPSLHRRSLFHQTKTPWWTVSSTTTSHYTASCIK